MRNLILICFFFYCHTVIANETSVALSNILTEINRLESNNDPKCYATAARLEDFMFGTPLTDEARFNKNNLQKKLALYIWHAANNLQKNTTNTFIDALTIDKAMTKFFTVNKSKKGHWQVTFNNKQSLLIHQDDLRQYSSIAYSLRAFLAVQQQQMLAEQQLPPLSPVALNRASFYIDIYTLAILKLADNEARLIDKRKITRQAFEKIWQTLEPRFSTSASAQNNDIQNNDSQSKTLNNNPINTAQSPAIPQALKPHNFTFLKKIISQKVNAYQAYNNINNQLFFRNLQVYFAKASWPTNPEDKKALKSLITETVVAFANDFYLLSDQIAQRRGHSIIEEGDVNLAINSFIPYQVNEYEDVTFFPLLAFDEQITIEAYDIDAFRDSGLHWRYLQFAIEADDFQGKLEPSPFAIELITENIAQFAVLALRVAGIQAIAENNNRLSSAYFNNGLKVIQHKINSYQALNKNVPNKKTIKKQVINSAINKQASTFDNQYFSNITKQSGVNFYHKSSSWLNRLIRSYLPTGDNSATIIVPPAFGGSGVASGDINNDGQQDLLLLSGAGNKLYLNQQGVFKDITVSSNIDKWRRESDNKPGEPRQPLIADINNDGWQDIIIIYNNDVHRVYKNLTNNTFADVTDISLLGGIDLVAGAATVFDYDNDGLLDIFISYFGNYLKGNLPTLKRRNSNGLPDKLFKNLGGFKFKDVSKDSGIENLGWGQAVTHTDLNADGWQDLIVGNDFGVNAYYINQKNGHFIDVSAKIGTNKPSYTMNIALTDLNQDAQPDIYISNIVTMNKDQKYVLPNENTRMIFDANKLANMRVVEANDLFISTSHRKNALPNYQLSELIGRGYSATGWSWDADFFDFDNDGDDDLYVLNGMNEFNLYSSKNSSYQHPLTNEKMDILMPSSFKESNVFFKNDAGRLQNDSKKSGVDLLSNSRSAVYLDHDQDGDLDIVLNNYHEPAVVYKNNSEKLANNWLKIKLIGSAKENVNLDAIGANIIVSTKDGKKIWRQISGSTGYMSVHPKVQHIGLGDSKTADIKIIWPNGKVEYKKNIIVNKKHLFTYPNE